MLGPLEVTRDGEAVALGGPRQRALLAVLLLSANEVVPRERLVNALWGEEPPPTAANALQVAVHGLRKALGADRIERAGTGYRARVDPGELDLERFTGAVERSRSLAADASVAALRDALAMWRGRALADLQELDTLRRESQRLEEVRLAVVERRVEAELEAGAHDGLAAELERLVAEHPYRERLQAQLMLALYRAGRQVDALEAYRRARVAFVDELGMDPSPELQELERRSSDRTRPSPRPHDRHGESRGSPHRPHG